MNDLRELVRMELGVELAVGPERRLLLRAAQHEYTFTPAARGRV